MKNLRCGGALALIGCYLMMPPIAEHGEPDPPISQWEIRYSFDSAAACQALLNAVKADVTRSFKKKFGVSPDYDGFMSALKNAKNTDQIKEIQIALQRTGGLCIASDDPRLK
jgi:hypothetical protein